MATNEDSAQEMPFNRWLIKLLVEKLIVPVAIPFLTAVATSILGWYFIGQEQLSGQAHEAGVRAAEVEVEKLDKARELLRVSSGGEDKPLTPGEMDHELEALREKWIRATPAAPGADSDPLEQRLQEQRLKFPEDFIRNQLAATRR